MSAVKEPLQLAHPTPNPQCPTCCGLGSYLDCGGLEVDCGCTRGEPQVAFDWANRNRWVRHQGTW